MTIPDTMLEDLKINPDWKSLPLFDREGWTRVPFGAFAESIGERVEPADAEGEIYVGLEHIDPQDLHTRRWGTASDVTGTKLRFRKGDIIFGRRRAYQRKLAVAEMDGICSAHSLVVRARPELVLPEFLPFLMMSDRFMNRAVEISVGSLSPTINWGTLKLEEFDLPPIKQQRRIAEMLWASRTTIDQYSAIVAATVRLQNAEREYHLDQLYQGPCSPLSDILQGSPGSGCSAVPSSTSTGHYVLSLAALSRNGYVPENLKEVYPTPPMLAARLKKGDLLISRSNTQELVGLVGIFDEDRGDVSFPDTMMRLTVDGSRINSHFLELVLRSRRGRFHMM